MWHKNTIIYSLDVETFMDSNGDGIGDFQGLIQRLGHLQHLGVDCLWLQPFFPSPNRDDGYDVIDYYAIDARLGTMGDFAELAHHLDERGIRLIIDLVVNHTSDQHPWFVEACRDRQSPLRDFYIWSEDKPAHADQGMVFPGSQATTWTWNKQAGAYYFHRFFQHQPDLNIANPAVRQEILRVMGFWLRLGVSGFRIDAAPFLIELTDRRSPQGEAMYGFLRDMHDLVAWRTGNGILLAEANVANDVIEQYFGDGDAMHMLFNFLVNQPMFLAFARKRAGPLADALRVLPTVPPKSQWAQFLRNHDELDLGRLSDAERQEVFAAFAPEPHMHLYGRGLRRRLASMFRGDQRRVEMAHSLMFALPGTQILRYGDEIGMGEDLSLPERRAVRTPMQWSASANGGFSAAPAERLISPVIDGDEYGYGAVNVEAQVPDETSLLNRIARLVRARRGRPEIGYGQLALLDSGHPAVLAHVCRWGDRAMMALHNLSDEPCRVAVGGLPAGVQLVPVIGDRPYPRPGAELALSGYGYRWFRLGGAVEI